MDKVLDFILLFLSQFAGGPGPVENNLVRFGLPAILWAVLLMIAWTRQREQDLPREKLLIWGFGLALVREVYMFGQMSYRLLSSNAEANCEVIQPLEHGLAMAAMIVVAAAFLLYILQDQKIAKRYLLVGISITFLAFVLTSWAWPRHLADFPQIKFHQTWAAWIFHIPLAIILGVAIVLLLRKKGWLRLIVAAALSLYLLSEVLLLLNFATDRMYNSFICPVGNSLHILAIPLLGFVYLREQAQEKKQADQALNNYRDHLEEIVKQRTASLATQNALAFTLSQSLKIEENLQNGLQMLQDELGMEIGLIFLVDDEAGKLVPYLSRGPISAQDFQAFTEDDCLSYPSAQQALTGQKAIPTNLKEVNLPDRPTCPYHPELRSLISVPLVSNGQSVGLLTLASHLVVFVQPHQLEMLTANGLQIGMAIENDRLSETLNRQLELAAAMEERQRIAANMHDGLAQTLCLLGLQVEHLQDLIKDYPEPRAFEAIRQFRDTVSQATSDVRRSIASLQEAPHPRHSLQELLQEKLGYFALQGGPEISFEDGSYQPLFMQNDQADQVLLVVHEALHNARRHAQASLVSVRLEAGKKKARITIEDDGVGFDPDRPTQDDNHFGLHIMQARALRIDGQLLVDSTPGKGTRIYLTWVPVIIGIHLDSQPSGSSTGE